MSNYPRFIIFSNNKKLNAQFKQWLFSKAELILTDSTLQIQDCLEHDKNISRLICDLGGIEQLDPIIDILKTIQNKYADLKILLLTEHKQKSLIKDLNVEILLKPFNEEIILQTINNL
ncbi:MAG: hypothetical protein HQL25_07075 [Candidatus Omnitrophica bacterium]|nr:hypothetical protein [Candidatus Omnitrophota bacterium]